MTAAQGGDRHARTRARTERELVRFTRRTPGGSFWRSLSLVGSVGWPIVLLTTGGALLGHYLDARFGTGVHVTLLLVTFAAALGTYAAYRALKERRP